MWRIVDADLSAMDKKDAIEFAAAQAEQVARDLREAVVDTARFVAQKRKPGVVGPHESAFVDEHYAREYAAGCNAGWCTFKADHGVITSNPWAVIDTAPQAVSTKASPA